jgi:hypothetical protein
MVDSLDGTDSFPCATCGKVLKVPPALAAPNGAAPDSETVVPAPEQVAPATEQVAPAPEQLPPARRRRSSRTAAPAVASAAAVAQTAAADNPPGRVVASSAAPGAIPPPPRRRRRGPADGEVPAPSAPERVEPAPVAAITPDPVSTAPISAVAGAAAVGAGAASVAAAAAAGPVAAAGPRMVSSASPAAGTLLADPPDDTPAPKAKSKSGSRRAPKADASPPLPVVIRILIWVIALPLGLALVGIPARKAGYLTSQKLLDVVIKHNLDRFFPLAVIVVVWALVTAIIVHLLAEGGRAWMAHRRKAHEVAARPTVVSSGPGLAPPPRRRNGTNGDAAPQRESQAASRGGS